MQLLLVLVTTLKTNRDHVIEKNMHEKYNFLSNVLYLIKIEFNYFQGNILLFIYNIKLVIY
jgi:hypothetical protein